MWDSTITVAKEESYENHILERENVDRHVNSL